MEYKLMNLLLFYPVFLFSLSFHEAAHGYMAFKFGDPTAKLMGRVSLSPFPHMDMIGTLVLPILGILTNMPVIGWGKPVPVNPWNFTNARKGTLWVSAIGPLSNIFLSVAFAGVAWLLFLAVPHILTAPGSFAVTAVSGLFSITRMGVVLNLMLAAFNLIPIPPLDGSGIMKGILPASLLRSYVSIERYGMIIILLLFVTGAFKYLFYPVLAVASFLLPV